MEWLDIEDERFWLGCLDVSLKSERWEYMKVYRNWLREHSTEGGKVWSNYVTDYQQRGGKLYLEGLVDASKS